MSAGDTFESGESGLPGPASPGSSPARAVLIFSSSIAFCIEDGESIEDIEI
jgi:hypothetical protein